MSWRLHPQCMHLFLLLLLIVINSYCVYVSNFGHNDNVVLQEELQHDTRLLEEREQHMRQLEVGGVKGGAIVRVVGGVKGEAIVRIVGGVKGGGYC